MKNKQIIITVVLLIVFAIGGFFGGVKYQQSKTPMGFGNRQFNGVPRGTGGTNRNGFRPVSGEIISSDDKSITVKLMDGSSKIVLLSDKTVINKTSQAAKTDLTIGQTVLVLGMDNSDGSVSAQNIQLNPVMRGFVGASPTPIAK